MRAVPILIACVMWAAPALAQPSIADVDGGLRHGATVTITGSGFDSKATGAPLKWDDFQSVELGKEIVTSRAPGPAWTNNGGAPGNNVNPVASSRNLRPNTPFTRHMESQWHQPAGGSDAASNVALIGQKFRKMFVDAWLYNDTSAMKPNPSCCNFKHLRLHQDGAAGDKPNLGLTDTGPGTTMFFGTAGDNRLEPHNNSSDYATASEIYNRWVHLQWILDPNASAGPGKGRSRVYVNGALRASQDSDNLVNKGYDGWTELYVGNYVRTGDYTGTIYAFWETVMVDHGWNRIELANNANYAKATHREIQPWTSWDPVRVSFTVNRGSFSPGDRVYVCVVNDNDQAACNGPHVISPESGVAAPPVTATAPPPEHDTANDRTWATGIAVMIAGGIAGGVASRLMTRKTAGRRARVASDARRWSSPE